MEKIPSTLILHKKVDGADTRFAQSRTPMSEAPLETWLDVLECCACKKADNDPVWAFVKLDDMWSQEIEHDEHNDNSDNSDNSDDYDDEYTSSDSDDGNDDAAAYPAKQDYDDDDDARQRRKRPRGGPSITRPPEPYQHRASDSLPLPPTTRGLPRQAMFHRVPARAQPQSPWRLVQVSLDNSGPSTAKQFGIYCVKFYTANLRDQDTLPPCKCKFWHKIGVSEHRQRDKLRPLHPAQVSEHLRLNDNDYWTQADMHLAEVLLYGPFDFETRRKLTGPRQKVSKKTLVAEVYWKQLEDTAQ